MRKISKLSLVAAVAVAGFSTANAQPLEEAIKNVEVSGSVVYRYDNFGDDKGTWGTAPNDESHSEKNKYKIGLNLSSKVNDYVKFNSRFLVANLDGNGEFAELDAHKGSDANPDVTLSHANFAFTGIQNTTVIAGKQGLATPWTVAIDSDGNEHTGTGILALSTVGPVTAGAGYFNQTNLDKSGNINGTKYAAQSKDMSAHPKYKNNISLKNVSGISETALTAGEELGSRDLYVATLQADLSPVKLEAWYVDIADTLDSYTLVAKANFVPSTDSKLGVEARYVSLTLDNPANLNIEEDNSMYRLAVTGNLGIFNAKVSYTATDKDGGLTAFDQDAENATLGWNLSSNGIADAKYWQAVLGVNILDNLNLSANYGNLQADDSGNLEAEEVFAQLTYKMSKNLSTYVRYGTYEEEYDNAADKKEKFSDQNRGRIQVEYTF